MFQGIDAHIAELRLHALLHACTPTQQQAVPTVIDFVNLTLALCPALHSTSTSNSSSSSSDSSKARHMCHYIAEVCLQEAALGDTPPSVAAAACVVLALDLLGLLNSPSNSSNSSSSTSSSSSALIKQLQAVWRWSPLGGSGSVITALQRPLQILYMAHRAMPELSLQVQCRCFIVHCFTVRCCAASSRFVYCYTCCCVTEIDAPYCVVSMMCGYMVVSMMLHV
jgi:Cyclin, C-terminal domain